VQATHPEETAAIILEPILGEGGFLTPPPGFMGALRRLCDKHGMLLIADEVRGVFWCVGGGWEGVWHDHGGWCRCAITGAERQANRVGCTHLGQWAGTTIMV
jgi:4-aminobutyrate aminotransferase